MPKTRIVLLAAMALLTGALLTWNAQATVLSPTHTGATAYSPLVETVGCRRNSPAVGANGCKRGTHMVCQKKTGCFCADCPTGD